MGEDKCPLYDQCLKQRIKDSNFQGAALASLENLTKLLSQLSDRWEREEKDIWGAIQVNREDIKKLYYRAGLLSGGISFAVSIIVTLISVVIQKFLLAKAPAVGSGLSDVLYAVATLVGN